MAEKEEGQPAGEQTEGKTTYKIRLKVLNRETADTGTARLRSKDVGLGQPRDLENDRRLGDYELPATLQHALSEDGEGIYGG